MNAEPGAMVISLDFELLWGMIDHADIQSDGAKIIGARQAVIRILELFEKYDIHATWAVVGFLFHSNIGELKDNLPESVPQYDNKKYASYSYIDQIKEEDRNYYFAPELIQKIRETPYQEIASHTYSHYYCLENGQNEIDFENDLCLFQKIADKDGITVKSMVLPRNQINLQYVNNMKSHHIKCYRGTENSWCYKATNKKGNTLLKRAFRFLDAYINIMGNQCYGFDEINEGELKNIRSSRFFRPYNPKLAVFEGIRLHRIKRQMYYAAKHGKIFHMWWHPHNFGQSLEENLKNLEELLKYYSFLKEKFQFKSLNMVEASEV